MHRWDAERYQSSPSDTQKWGRELVSKLNLKGGERVLDIGCGDGRVAAEIAQLVPRGGAVGVDSSPEMVTVAQRHLSAAAIRQPAFSTDGRNAPGVLWRIRRRFFQCFPSLDCRPPPGAPGHSPQPEVSRQAVARDGWKGQCGRDPGNRERGSSGPTMAGILPAPFIARPLLRATRL